MEKGFLTTFERKARFGSDIQRTETVGEWEGASYIPRKQGSLPPSASWMGHGSHLRSVVRDLSVCPSASVDSNREDFDPAPVKSKFDSLDFDTLLKQAQKNLRR